MSWLSGLELESIIRTYADEATEAAFLGIFSIDTLPKQIKHLPILFIINTQTSNLQGQHWKAVYISSDKYGEVFDSLAMPVSLHLQNWLNTFTRKWSSSKRTIQYPFSASCGAFVIYFVLNRLKAKSMKTCLAMFKNNLIYNDALVVNFIKDLQL